MAADIMLWLDVLCRFMTPVAVADEGRKDGGQGEECSQLSHRRVACAYVRSGELLFDVLCRFPWDVVRAGARSAPFAFSAAHLPRLLTLHSFAWVAWPVLVSTMRQPRQNSSEAGVAPRGPAAETLVGGPDYYVGLDEMSLA